MDKHSTENCEYKTPFCSTESVYLYNDIETSPLFLDPRIHEYNCCGIFAFKPISEPHFSLFYTTDGLHFHFHFYGIQFATCTPMQT